MLLVHMPHACRYDHQIRHKKLSIESLKNQLSIFLGEKIHCSNLFYVFLKTSFLCRSPHCVTYDPPLTSSDRAEIFIANILNYRPEIESTVLISDVPILIYRVQNTENLVLAKTFTYFLYKKNKKVRVLKKLKTTSEI
jgi:hypothetical protein